MKKHLQGCHVITLLFLINISLSPFYVCSQVTNATIFRDDFNRENLGAFWNAASSWSIADNAAYNSIDGVGGILRTAAGYTDSSYVIETSAKGFNLNYRRSFAITFGQVNASNDSMYEVVYTAYGGGRLTLYRSTTNVYYGEPLDEVAVYPGFNATQWYNFRIARYKSGLIQVYADEGPGYSKTPVLEAIDATYPVLGHTGWRIDTETYAESFYVDWMVAGRPAIDKPAVKEKPEEDDLITQVSSPNRNSYKVNKLNKGARAFIDRNYTITSFPGYLNRASFIQTAMDDKFDSTDVFLTAFLKKEAIVYIAYDPRASKIPDWLSGWTKTGDQVGITDPGTDHLDIYSKLVQGGEIYPLPLLLGGNMAGRPHGAKMNYLVAAVPRPQFLPLQAEDAIVSGGTIANDHINYDGTGFVNFINPSDDYIEWNVNISVPGVYNLAFKYANAGHTDRPLEITDNNYYIATLPFSPLSLSWDTWAFETGADIFLSSGVHKIRLKATGLSGPNIDALSLYYSAASFSPNITYASSDYNSTELRSLLHGEGETGKAYPNPFSDRTCIYFTVKEKAKVTLSVYSLQGQQMQLLIDDFREPGEYKSTVESGKFSSGIYFYRLQIGKQIKVGRLVKQ